ncbi:MAG: transcription-repair coupling factor [Ardenticatenia bacterium]|nr:transcription-repair coupling factor [Ardenticatenia bacterium]
MKFDGVSGLLPLLCRHPGVRRLIADVCQGLGGEPGAAPPALHVIGAARAALTAVLAWELNVSVILLTARPDRALHVYEELRRWAPDPTRIVHFPEPGPLPYERAPWSPERAHKRLGALTALHHHEEGTPLVVVASARAVLQPTMPAEVFRMYTRTYAVGRRVSFNFVIASWYALGYEPATTVVEPGQSSRRGGILDIFPVHMSYPVRMELWGDEVESLRLFDPESQRSVDHISQVTVPPAREAMVHRFGEQAAVRLGQLDLSGLTEEARQEWIEDIDRLVAGQLFPHVEFYMPYLYDPPGILVEHMPPGGLIVVDDWEELRAHVADVERRALDMRRERVERGELPGDVAPALFTWDDLIDRLADHRVLVLGYGGTPVPYGLDSAFAPGRRFGGRLHEAVREVQRLVDRETVVLVSRQADRVGELLGAAGLHVIPRRGLTAPPDGHTPTLQLVRGALEEGFVLRGDSGQSPGGEALGAGPALLHLMTDAELFGWSRTPPSRPLRPRRFIRVEDVFKEIAPGDYVVHVDHGVGLFRGLARRELNGVVREYLEIEYANGDRLYVPVHQADRVARYVGPGGAEPRVHRLGTADWEMARRHAKRAVDEIAEELLDLYAAREAAQGFAFSPDTPWQAELEAAFPHEETEDQVRAIEAVKRDMERPRPMDRLVCGDAGFGKTEVAVRAAFKAVMDGKQVAVLVPTTVLAQQHYHTFRRRLAPFPVEVDVLSRFRSPAQQTRVLERLAQGLVDIVIGTHRLLSPDVRFKDLGLVIIDEEHRFGVTQKEHFKRLRTTVDVLALSATPIPRTLHMALTGVRDLSVIETPPQERLPVVTKVAPWDERVVRTAIVRELERGGQVFFVHNRVLTIHVVAQHVQRLVPGAKVAVAHGRMDEQELERTMAEFAEGHHDVLVCTSIIESGLDLPNVNTILVNHAEQFGLAQLYQLRGRVGRGIRRGYAYFLHPPEEHLAPEALERLQAIREAVGPGAGFRIALKDLQLRGAGDILGARQSGHIAAVGFDMYTRLLAQAIREKRALRSGQPLPASGNEAWPAVDLPLPAHVPEEYVPAPEVRLRLYQRMAAAVTLADVEALARELRDRFGPPPAPAENLLYILRLRALARLAGVEAVQRDGDAIVLLLPGPTEARHLAQADVVPKVAQFGRREVRVPWRGRPPEVWKDDVDHVLRAIAEFVERAGNGVRNTSGPRM